MKSGNGGHSRFPIDWIKEMSGTADVNPFECTISAGFLVSEDGYGYKGAAPPASDGRKMAGTEPSQWTN